MRWFKNEKGSLALVMMVLILVGTSALTLSSLVLSDRSGEAHTKHFIQKNFQEESLYEMIYFEIASMLDNRYYSMKNEPILSASDVSTLQNQIVTRLTTDYQQFSGENLTLSRFKAREEGFTVYDLCQNENTCTFDLTFEVEFMSPQKGYFIKLTNLQWNNVGTLESPIFQLSTLHSKWQFESRK